MHGVVVEGSELLGSGEFFCLASGPLDEEKFVNFSSAS